MYTVGGGTIGGTLGRGGLIGGKEAQWEEGAQQGEGAEHRDQGQ